MNQLLRATSLEAQLEAARERIAVLEEALGLTNYTPLQLQLTKNEAIILGVLMKHESARKEAFMNAIYGNKAPDDEAEIKIIDVFVCKMRHKLKPFGIEISTVWGSGYSMDAESKKRVRELSAESGGWHA